MDIKVVIVIPKNNHEFPPSFPRAEKAMNDCRQNGRGIIRWLIICLAGLSTGLEDFRLRLGPRFRFSSQVEDIQFLSYSSHEASRSSASC